MAPCFQQGTFMLQIRFSGGADSAGMSGRFTHQIILFLIKIDL